MSKKKETSVNDIAIILGKVSSKIDFLGKKIGSYSRTTDHHSDRIDKLFEYFNLFDVKLSRFDGEITDLRSVVSDAVTLVDDRFEKIDSKLQGLERRIDDFATTRETKDHVYKLSKRLEILESKIANKR